MSFNLIAGDLAPNLGITLEVGDLVEPLSASQYYQFHFVSPSGLNKIATLTPVDLTAATFEYVWQIGDTAEPGFYRGRVMIVLSTGKTQSFPSDGTWIYWFVAPFVD